MEEWQRIRINNNLVELIKNTNCSVVLLSRLQQTGVLSQCDVEELQSLQKNLDKSRRLYEILSTKCGAFDILSNALNEVEQTGAYRILQQHETKFKDFGQICVDMNHLIGKGQSGTKVYKGKYGGREVAVKVINEDPKKAEKEVNILQAIDDHQNIVRHFHAELRNDKIYIALELCRINLEDEIRLQLLRPDRMFVLESCTKGLAFLHEQKVVHRDIKPANILINRLGYVKIADFGLSQVYFNSVSSSSTSGAYGTLDWMAPEVIALIDGDADIHNRTKKTGKEDIFALGCIFYFVLSNGEHLFGKWFERQLHMKTNTPQWGAERCIKTRMKQMIIKMVSHSPFQRPTAQDILDSKVFGRDDEITVVSTSTTGSTASGNADTLLPVKALVDINTPDENGKEDWQIRHILDNLPTLIRLTTCNVIFLSIIRKAGALSEYDEQKLVHKFLVPVEKSKRFYEILLTRKKCYHILRDALEQTRQTGALETLNDVLLTDVLNDLEVPLIRIGELKNNIDLKLSLDGCTLVHKAVKIGGVEQLQKLKLLKADFEAKDADGYTPVLRLAQAKKNFAETLAWFVDEQIDQHAVDNMSNNLVFLAAFFERSKYELQLLINAGIKWDVTNKNCQNIMHLAAGGGNTEALKYFKSMGADVNARDKFEYTPLLRLANAKRNLAETLAWFVSEQEDLHVVNVYGNNLVFLAASNGKSKDELQLLAKYGFKWEIKNKTGQTIMHLAAKGGNAEALKYFKSLGADVNARDNFGCTPLLYLAYIQTNFVDTLAWFVSEQIDLHAVDHSGNNLVFLAAFNGKSKGELQLLVENGGKWDIKNKNCQNIMHLAATGGNTEALKHFKSLGADVNARDEFGRTPLLPLAYAETNFAETLAWFVSEQIDLHAVDNAGNNLVFLAAFNGRSKDELQLLVDSGVKWDIKNKKGQNIIQLAAEAGNAEALKYFKSLGADINA